MRYKFVTLTNPAEGQDAEYDEWSDRQHIPDVLAIPGFISAQRFRVNSANPSDRPQRWKTATVYEVETNDPAAFFANLSAAAREGRMPVAACFDLRSAYIGLLEPITEPVYAHRPSR